MNVKTSLSWLFFLVSGVVLIVHVAISINPFLKGLKYDNYFGNENYSDELWLPITNSNFYLISKSEIIEGNVTLFEFLENNSIQIRVDNKVVSAELLDSDTAKVLKLNLTNPEFHNVIAIDRRTLEKKSKAENFQQALDLIKSISIGNYVKLELVSDKNLNSLDSFQLTKLEIYN